MDLSAVELEGGSAGGEAHWEVVAGVEMVLEVEAEAKAVAAARQRVAVVDMVQMATAVGRT